jgi:hypothetical protein
MKKIKQILKFKPNKGDPPEGFYQVIVFEDGSVECDCMGFIAKGKCKHIIWAKQRSLLTKN